MNFLRTFLIFFFFSFNLEANENSKIRYIDVDFIFKNSSVGKKTIKITNDEREKLIKKNQSLEKNLEKQKNDILTKKNVTDPKEFEKKVISHQKDVENYQIKNNEEVKKINKKFLDMNLSFKKQLDNILIEFANDNKIDLIFDKKTIIVSNSKLDVTKNILDIVNEKIKKVD